MAPVSTPTNSLNSLYRAQKRGAARVLDAAVRAAMRLQFRAP